MDTRRSSGDRGPPTQPSEGNNQNLWVSSLLDRQSSNLFNPFAGSFSGQDTDTSVFSSLPDPATPTRHRPHLAISTDPRALVSDSPSNDPKWQDQRVINEPRPDILSVSEPEANKKAVPTPSPPVKSGFQSRPPESIHRPASSRKFQFPFFSSKPRTARRVHKPLPPTRPVSFSLNRGPSRRRNSLGLNMGPGRSRHPPQAPFSAAHKHTGTGAHFPNRPTPHRVPVQNHQQGLNPVGASFGLFIPSSSENWYDVDDDDNDTVTHPSSEEWFEAEDNTPHIAPQAQLQDFPSSDTPSKQFPFTEGQTLQEKILSEVPPNARGRPATIVTLPQGNLSTPTSPIDEKFVRQPNPMLKSQVPQKYIESARAYGSYWNLNPLDLRMNMGSKLPSSRAPKPPPFTNPDSEEPRGRRRSPSARGSSWWRRQSSNSSMNELLFGKPTSTNTEESTPKDPRSKRSRSTSASRLMEKISLGSLGLWNNKDRKTKNKRRNAPLKPYQHYRPMKLTRGHFVQESPVPSPIQNVAAQAGVKGGPREFSHIRYTAATCEPQDFTVDKGYTLRTGLYGRETDLAVCITVYNEPKELLTRTLHHTMLNIQDLVKSPRFKRPEDEMGNSSINNAWRRVVIVVVLDGFDFVDKSVLDVFSSIGAYQEDLMRRSIDGKETVMHFFEHTAQVSVTPNMRIVHAQPKEGENAADTSFSTPVKEKERSSAPVSPFSPKAVQKVRQLSTEATANILRNKNEHAPVTPMQIILSVKQKNAKKINSQRWFLQGLCEHHLNPQVVILMDVGTKPARKSFLRLWEEFIYDKHLGGACGEIHPDLGPYHRRLLNPLVGAQNFEYKMSNILDKPTESIFGYVAVLPGAFSAYRFSALQGRPLRQYYLGDPTTRSSKTLSIWRKNMYLAEDRILCWELVAKEKESWHLRYIRGVKGETDVPDHAAELIAQRRRWLNGSFAAAVYSLVNLSRVWYSNHSVARQLLLHVQAVLNFSTLVMSWFTLANFFLIFYIMLDIVANNLRYPYEIAGATRAVIECWANTPLQVSAGYVPEFTLHKLNYALSVVYVSFLVYQIILALGCTPRAERHAYLVSIIVFGILVLWLIGNSFFLTVKSICPLGSLSLSTSHQVISSVVTSYVSIFAGLAGTFGVYIISSLLFADPWHLFTSLPSYLLMSPSYTNVINVYAFCNLNDVSWGTKGAERTAHLPEAHSKTITENERVTLITENDQAAIDIAFRKALERVVVKQNSTGPDTRPLEEDQENRRFRTRFITLWFVTNLGLALAILNLSHLKRQYYCQIILWINFALSFLRLFGSFFFVCAAYLSKIKRLLFPRSRQRTPVDIV